MEDSIYENYEKKFTKSSSSSSSKLYDVIICGCGPSGSLLGYFLSLNNIKTLIIEKEEFPREKICAGGLQHRAVVLLPYDIDKVIEKTIYGINFSFKTKDIFYKKNASPIIYTVKRSNFDNFLAQNAKETGCQINFGEKVIDFKVDEREVEVITSKKNAEEKTFFVYKTKILVGADGIRGIVHNKILKNKKINKIIGFETEINFSSFNDINNYINKELIKKFNLEDSIILDFGGVKKGYGWIFPKTDSISAGVGAPFNLSKKAKDYFYFFLKNFPFADFKLQNKNNLKIKAHGIPIRAKNTPFCDFRILTVGDAASIGDGFTGEGLYNCFRSSIFASKSILNALKISNFSFVDYYDYINNEIFTDIKASLIFTKVFYSSAKFFYKLLKNNETLFYSCCKILRGERQYKDVLKRLNFLNFYS